jgi:hypothetical protein
MKYHTIDTNFGPITISVPNSIMDAGDFYISYNDTDVEIYGSDTTALVIGQTKFYILKGDFREQYKSLLLQGVEACLGFYMQNLALSHRHSDKLPE